MHTLNYKTAYTKQYNTYISIGDVQQRDWLRQALRTIGPAGAGHTLNTRTKGELKIQEISKEMTNRIYYINHNKCNHNFNDVLSY